MNLNDSNVSYKFFYFLLLILLLLQLIIVVVPTTAIINLQTDDSDSDSSYQPPQPIVLLESEYKCALNLLQKFVITRNEFGFINSTLYDFCQAYGIGSPMLRCDSNNRTVTYFYIPYITVKKKNILRPSDLYCFLNLNSFEINNIPVLDNFLYSKIAQLPKSLNRIDFYGNITNFLSVFKINNTTSNDYLNSNIQRISIKGGQIYKPLDIYFSKFKSLNYFEMWDNNIENTNLYPIIIHNDLNYNKTTQSKKFQYFKIISNNVPSMRNISIPYLSYLQFTFSITLLPNFQIESFSKFSSYPLVGGIEIISNNKDLVYPFPISLFNSTSNNNKLIAIKFDYTIDRISNFLNISNFNELHWISIPNAGKLFNVDGKFPFSSLPKYISNFELSNGNFKEIPDFNSDDIFGKEIKTIILRNNQMGGIIPKSLSKFENSNLDTIDLSNNELTGEIDESWCNFDFNIANNMIGGNAPQCITCHLNYQYYKIAGNQFVNIQPDTIPPCDLVINLLYDNQTELFILYGKNLGSDTGTYKIDGVKNNQFNPNLKFIWEGQGFDYYNGYYREFYKYIGESSSDNPFGMNLTFLYLPQGVTTFQVTAYNHFQPLIYSISKYSNYFIINGKYFAYNQTVIQVLISNQVCNVISCNFNTIQCYLEFDETTTTTTTSTASVKIMDLISSDFKFSINDNDEVCNGINCPIPNCNVKYGKYNSNSGQCDCIKGWHGYTCDIKDLECPGCKEGNGVCNPIIGICKCNPNRIFNDCSGIKCMEECLNGGECNNSIGKCICPSSNLWIGDSCNTPNISVSTQDQIISKSGIISTFIGWFGSTSNQLHIMINDSICDLLLFDPNTIKCLSPLNSTLCSGMSLTIIQNNFKWIGSYSTNVALNDQICLHHQNSSSSSEDSSNSTIPKSSNSSKNLITLLLVIIPTLLVLTLAIILFYKKYFNSKSMALKYKILRNKIFHDDDYEDDDHDDDNGGIPLSNFN